MDRTKGRTTRRIAVRQKRTLRSSGTPASSVTFISIATLAAALTATSVKALGSSNLSAYQVLFVQFGVSAVGIGIYLLLFEREQFRVHRPFTMIARMLVGVASFVLYYKALSYTTVAYSTLLVNSAPLFVAIFSFYPLKRKIKLFSLMGIILGFIGIVFALHPAHGLQRMGFGLGLAAGGLTAIDYLLVNKLSETDRSGTIMFYYCLGAALLMGMISVLYWRSVSELPLFILLASGVLMLALQLFLTLAFSTKFVLLVASLTYLTVIFSGISDWVFWGKLPTLYLIVGAVLVAAGGIITQIQDRRK